MRRIELERKRSIKMHKKFYDMTIRDIKNSKRKFNNARLRSGLYKQFFEEYIVLLKYTSLKYKGKKNISFKWTGEKQKNKKINYDGEIYKKNEVIERVEITNPLFSKRDKKELEQLNKFGCSDIDIQNFEEALENVKSKIVVAANNKNNKRTYDDTVVLIIYMEDWKHFFKNVEKCNDILEEIVDELSKIQYRFKEVYLLESINDLEKLIKVF